MKNHESIHRGRRDWKLSPALAAVCLVLATLSVPMAAQSAEEVAQGLKGLDTNSQMVAVHLTKLMLLPAEEWRIHPANLPHGESPELDDSSWQIVKPEIKLPHDAVWFRRWIEIPKDFRGYDLTGARIWFRFDASANGPSRRSFTSTDVASRWAKTWNRSSFSIRPSPETKCWWPSRRCTAWT